jgi:thiamine pyrophosphokinase
MKKCIILANGKPPKKSLITFFQKLGYTTLICADGGSDSAMKMNLIPDVIIGDLDSISFKSKEKFRITTKIIQIKRQNDTDVEKCLKFAIKKKFDEAMLVGVTGNRLDHSFCNLGIVLKYFPQINISLIAEDSFLKPYSGVVKLKTIPGETISIYGFNNKTLISSNGLKYPLQKMALPFGVRESTSNVAISKEVILEISGGAVFVIRDVNEMIKHDLI